jgi:hypothetical protein
LRPNAVGSRGGFLVELDFDEFFTDFAESPAIIWEGVRPAIFSE